MALFNLLQARVTKLENTVRWTWEEDGHHSVVRTGDASDYASDYASLDELTS